MSVHVSSLQLLAHISLEDAADCVVDGPDDNGIDAIYIGLLMDSRPLTIMEGQPVTPDDENPSGAWILP